MQTASRTMPKIPGETAAPNTGLLGKQKCSQKNTDVIFIFIFGMESSTGKKKILVGIPLSTSITLCFSANESGLTAAFPIPARAFTKAPQQ